MERQAQAHWLSNNWDAFLVSQLGRCEGDEFFESTASGFLRGLLKAIIASFCSVHFYSVDVSPVAT